MSPTTDHEISNDDELQDAIVDFNRTYLLLARQLIRANGAEGARCFGLSEEMASQIGNLTAAQIETLATSDKLVCCLRTDDPTIFASLMH
jgi:flagellar transcriptional activator FlhD